MNGSQLVYIPRGTNFLTDWSAFSRYANTQMFNACINVGSTAWWGLVNPLPSNYTPSGWTSGSFSDGTKYFYSPNAGRKAMEVSVLDEKLSQFNIAISPNPTTGKVTLDFVLEDANPLRINVYDSQGKNLLIYDLEGKSGGNSIPLDLSTFSTGSYLLNVQTGNKQSTKRVIKID